MSFPRYPAYKPSGVEWLGEVPEHWGVMRLSRKLENMPCYGVLVPEYVDDGVPMLRINDIENGLASRDDLKKISTQLSDEYSRTLLEEGDIALAVVGTIGRSLIVDKQLVGCNLSRAVAKVRPSKDLSSRMLRWIFESLSFKRYTDLLCVGTAQRVLNMSTLASFCVTIPSCQEQVSIATFLDHETAKIDALISEQQRLIELLQEKRQAVISHAVTKGLNPDAPMKDSGVEWLGEVPEHWDVTPLKYLSEIKAGFAFKSDEFTDSGVPVLRIGDIGRDGTVDFCDAKYLAAEALDDHSDVLVKHGDIVMAMTGATIGKAARYTAAEPALLNQRVCIFRARHPESQPYVWFALATHYYAEYLTITAFGGAQPNISDSELVACHVPIPPVKERVDIAMRLSEDMANMVVLETEAQQAISLLQERRSALISAAVTGQIDVRGLVAEAEAA